MKVFFVFDVTITPWFGFFLHSFIPSPCGAPVRKIGGGRSIDFVISPKGNQTKEIRYEQTRKIFSCFFGEYLMHGRSGLCDVNLRVVGRKPIIFKSNVALSEQSFDLQRNAFPTHLH